MEKQDNFTPDLQRRFEVVKGYRIEDGLSATDKDVWEEMRAVAVQNREYALADDMQGFVEDYDKRISAIDKELLKLV